MPGLPPRQWEGRHICKKREALSHYWKDNDKESVYIKWCEPFQLLENSYSFIIEDLKPAYEVLLYLALHSHIYDVFHTFKSSSLCLKDLFRSERVLMRMWFMPNWYTMSSVLTKPLCGVASGYRTTRIVNPMPKPYCRHQPFLHDPSPSELIYISLTPSLCLFSLLFSIHWLYNMLP